MMNKLIPMLAALCAWSSWPSNASAKSIDDCGKDEIDAMKELSAEQSIHLGCNLNLDSDDTIKAHLVLRGEYSSGVSVDCGGGELYKVTIISSKSGDEWTPVTDLSIRNCTVQGPLQVTGMGPTGHGPDVIESSHEEGHVARVRAAAPTRITLDNLIMIGGGTELKELQIITAKGWTPLFVGPGVSYLSLTNSELTGVSPGPGLYLDSESHHNTIQSNYIHVDTRSRKWGVNHFREQLAVDNSSSNTIINNSFASLLGGGVHLYRNCGEDGAVRITTPHHNHIINNFFYYSSGFSKDSPAIFLGSRDGTERPYCNLDDPFSSLGSAADDRSFARYNVVAQNQIRKLSTSKMIKVGDSSNKPNYIEHNETVQSQLYRQAGCYRSDGAPLFVPDGATMGTGSNAPIWTCSNHTLGLVPQLISTIL